MSTSNGAWEREKSDKQCTSNKEQVSVVCNCERYAMRFAIIRQHRKIKTWKKAEKNRNGTQNNNQLTAQSEKRYDLYKLTSWSNSHGLLNEAKDRLDAASYLLYIIFLRRRRKKSVRDDDDDDWGLIIMIWISICLVHSTSRRRMRRTKCLRDDGDDDELVKSCCGIIKIF